MDITIQQSRTLPYTYTIATIRAISYSWKQTAGIVYESEAFLDALERRHTAPCFVVWDYTKCNSYTLYETKTTFVHYFLEHIIKAYCIAEHAPRHTPRLWVVGIFMMSSSKILRNIMQGNMLAADLSSPNEVSYT